MMYKFNLIFTGVLLALSWFYDFNEVVNNIFFIFDSCNIFHYMEYLEYVQLKFNKIFILLQFLIFFYIFYYIFMINGFIFFFFYCLGRFLYKLQRKKELYLNLLKQYYLEKFNMVYYLVICWKNEFLFNHSFYLMFLLSFIYIFCLFVGLVDTYFIQYLAYWEVDPRYLDEFGPCFLYEEQDTFRKYINDADYDKYYVLVKDIPDYREEFNTPYKRDNFHILMYYYTFDPLINFEDIETAPVEVQHERLQHYYIMQKIYQRQFVETVTFIAKNINYKNYKKLKDLKNIEKYVLDFDVIDLWHWLAVIYGGEFKTPLNKFIFGHSFMDLCNMANLYVKGDLTEEQKNKYGLHTRFDYVCLLFEIVYRLMYDESHMLPLFGDNRHMNGDIKKIWVSGTFFGRMEVERMRENMHFSDYYLEIFKNHVKLIMFDYIFVWWGPLKSVLHSESAWPCNIFIHRHKIHNKKFKKYLVNRFYSEKQKRVLDLFNDYYLTKSNKK